MNTYLLIGACLGLLYMMVVIANIVFEFSRNNLLTYNFYDDEPISLEAFFYIISMAIFMSGFLWFLWPLAIFALILIIIKRII